MGSRWRLIGTRCGLGPSFSIFEVHSSPGPGSTFSPLPPHPERDTDTSPCLGLPKEGLGYDSACPPQRDLRQGLRLVPAPPEDVVGEGSEFSWLLSNHTKWGLAPMWVKAILGDLIPQHLLHARRGAGLFRGRAEQAAKPCPLAVPIVL